MPSTLIGSAIIEHFFCSYDFFLLTIVTWAGGLSMFSFICIGKRPNNWTIAVDVRSIQFFSTTGLAECPHTHACFTLDYFLVWEQHWIQCEVSKVFLMNVVSKPSPSVAIRRVHDNAVSTVPSDGTVNTSLMWRTPVFPTVKKPNLTF